MPALQSSQVETEEDAERTPNDLVLFSDVLRICAGQLRARLPRPDGRHNLPIRTEDTAYVDCKRMGGTHPTGTH